MAVKRTFTCSMATLLYDGDLILAAAEGQTDFAAKRLDNDLLTNARALWTGLGGKGGSAGAGTSATGQLTQQQNAAVINLLDYFGRAKESAKKAFKGQETKLAGEFTIGENTPRDLASILQRAKTVRDACGAADNTGPLKSLGGWIADDTAKLAAAITEVGEIDRQQLASITVEIAGTDARNTAANTLYANLLTIQSAANNEWPESNPSNRAMRGEFRIGDFPPAQKKSKKTSGKTDAASGASGAPKA